MGCSCYYSLTFPLSHLPPLSPSPSLTSPLPSPLDSISKFLVSPSSFFVQLIRLSLCICAFIILLAFYNTLSVMNRQILSTATCSLYWVLMTVAMALK